MKKLILILLLLWYPVSGVQGSSPTVTKTFTIISLSEFYSHSYLSKNPDHMTENFQNYVDAVSDQLNEYAKKNKWCLPKENRDNVFFLFHIGLRYIETLEEKSFIDTDQYKLLKTSDVILVGLFVAQENDCWKN